MDIQFEALHKKSWDNVLILTGDEGTGKSNLALHMLEYWLIKKYGKVLKDHSKYINLDIGKWSESFAECNKGDMNILDESGDLSNKRTMSKLNFAIARAYQIIRGDNIDSIFVLPSIFDLDAYFAKRRAKGLIYVYKRGRFAFWSKDRLRKLIELNAGYPSKDIWRIRPTFLDHFPIYKGVLLEEYQRKKEEYMKDTRKELANAIKDLKGGSEISERDNAIIKMKASLGAAKTAEIMGLSERQVYNIWKKKPEE